ncbi:hypothetical protein FKG94_06245 [Exilibacterium tricleocarpae]|uniref:Uncharacterized protein n=1 Tax=Exilibacterium tricleocarpae TaxID=2591008 RepID=A0A545U486_9GAMM|nr:hypothetical protein [Exilibacterium tricleocarpae]TQV84254.1 hypothetical protein FKG94_06245 [Exilibacterium tricleocarpae]
MSKFFGEAGVPLAEIKEAMRHSNIKETEKYAHLAKGTAAKVVSVLDGVQRTHTGKTGTSRDVLLVEKLLMESRC